MSQIHMHICEMEREEFINRFIKVNVVTNLNMLSF